jgi:large subunit ribosomal protein L24
MKRFHVKKNDEVQVISGSHRGQTGKVLQVIAKKERVIIEGVNLVKKATRATQNNPKGGFVEKEGSLHISNVKLLKAATASGKK